MSITSINTVDKVNYSENINSVSTTQEEEEELFSSNVDLENQDTIEIQEKETTTQELDLRDEFNKTKEEQGLIGNIWDGFKNLFNIGSGSNKAEEAISKYEAGEISKEEAQEALNKYKDSQDLAVNITANIGSGVAAGYIAPVIAGALSLSPLGLLGVAATIGMGLKIAVKSTEAAIGGKDYTAKNFCYDAVTGFINGAFSPISGGLAGAASNGIARTCGYKTAESSVKNIGQGILGKVLAQSGIKYAAEEGTKTGIRLLGEKGLMLGATLTVNGVMGGGVDSVASATGNIISDVVASDSPDSEAQNINQQIDETEEEIQEETDPTEETETQEEQYEIEELALSA